MNHPKVTKIAGLVIVAVLLWLKRDFVARKWHEFFATKEFYTLLETFFNEAAVLWFVFPLIDAIYKIRSTTDTSPPSLYKVIVTSWSAAAVFFYLAVSAKRNAGRWEK